MRRGENDHRGAAKAEEPAAHGAVKPFGSDKPGRRSLFRLHQGHLQQCSLASIWDCKMRICPSCSLKVFCTPTACSTSLLQSPLDLVELVGDASHDAGHEFVGHRAEGVAGDKFYSCPRSIGRLPSCLFFVQAKIVSGTLASLTASQKNYVAGARPFLPPSFARADDSGPCFAEASTYASELNLTPMLASKMPWQPGAMRIAKATRQITGGVVTGGRGVETDVDFDSYKGAPEHCARRPLN